MVPMPPATPATHAHKGSASAFARALEAWLWLLAVLVLLMVSVGGATRLTGSGLSITEWQPIVGVIPPLSDADWQAAFALYKQIPQYVQVNQGMTLGEFKAIFWWEWSHRLLGRLIGIVLAVPLAWFWWKGAITKRLGRQLLGLFALGGLQGIVGWYMVTSGLSERVSVSQYRLAAHLGLAILILGSLVWIALGLRRTSAQSSSFSERAHGSRRRGAVYLVALIFAQILLGAFVAGLKAGFAYNTWPLMEGRLVPDHLLVLSPWVANLFENIPMVQFNHRLMAYVVLVAAGWHAWRLQRTTRDGRVTGSAWALCGTLLAQAALGIWTLLAVVPLPLGIAHQAGAALVFCVAVWHLHEVHGAPITAAGMPGADQGLSARRSCSTR